MHRPRIVMADDHRIVVEGIRSLLESEFNLIEIAENGVQLVEAAIRLAPDVILADITMPRLNGIEALEQLRSLNCTAKVIILTMHKDATYAARALRAGASGFVLKHSASSELVTAIREALTGRTYVTPALSETLNECSDSRSRRETDSVFDLTPRQREVLQLFAEGRSAKEVAHSLHISTRTAENHKARIMKLLGLSTTADLVQYALRHQIIGPE